MFIFSPECKPIVLLYSDGGPDHRCTYASVKLSLMSLFIAQDLDMLVALRTAPGHSWANPVERIMSIVNIGLQGIGVMRAQGSDELKKAICKWFNQRELKMFDIVSEL